MQTTNETETGATFQLLNVRDVRPVDWSTGKRLPVDADLLPECVRCGRRHAVVWTLRELPSGRTLTVGSGCGPKLLAEGLLPGVDLPAVAAAKKLAAAEVRAIRRAGAEARALELAALARAAGAAAGDPPAPVWTAEDRGWETETCAVGGSVRCVNAADLRKAAGEWGRVLRADVERSAAAGWRDGIRMAALVAAGCPRGAQHAVCRLANAETEATLRDAAASLLR